MSDLKYDIDTEEEADGRWIAEITNLPGVMAYGASRDEAIANAEAVALRISLRGHGDRGNQRGNQGLRDSAARQIYAELQP